MFEISSKLIEKIWDVVAEFWDKLPSISPGKKIEKFHKTVEKFIISFLKKHSDNPTVLDLGCGTGKVLNALQKNGFDKLYGIDISSKMIEKTKTVYFGKLLWSRWVTKNELKKLIESGEFKKVSIHKRGIGLIALAKKKE
ncbi:MAG: methyltransferase domain-containing protein [Candidatus Aenigmarchaeota archaeon]|nr:methyltransferase domain-containing protein [Candidatus Aenigmarchaeota archaeon]